MNRRHFLSTLAAAVAGATLDPERLLWRPGAKTYFDIVKPPAPSGWLQAEGWSGGGLLTKGDVITIEGHWAVHPITREALPFLQQFVVTEMAVGAEVVELWPRTPVPHGTPPAKAKTLYDYGSTRRLTVDA